MERNLTTFKEASFLASLNGFYPVYIFIAAL